MRGCGEGLGGILFDLQGVAVHDVWPEIKIEV